MPRNDASNVNATFESERAFTMSCRSTRAEGVRVLPRVTQAESATSPVFAEEEGVAQLAAR